MKIKKGDILVDRGGDKRKVLAVLEDLAFLSVYWSPNETAREIEEAQGKNSPASDTGYSICLDDVINFINSK